MNRRQKSMNIIQMSQKTKFQCKNGTEKWTCVHAYIWTRIFYVLFTNLSQQIHLAWTQNIQTTAKHGGKPHFSPSVSYLVPPADSWYDRSSCSVLILNARPSSSTFLLHIALSLLSFKYRFILFFDSGYFQWTLLITLSESDWISVRIHNIWTDKLRSVGTSKTENKEWNINTLSTSDK